MFIVAGENWKLAMVTLFCVLVVVVVTVVVGVVVVVAGVVVAGVVVGVVLYWLHPARNIRPAAQIRSGIFFMVWYDKD
jgi:hypothetical protein